MAHDEQQVTDGWQIFADFSDTIRDLVLDAELDANPELDESHYIEQFGLLKSKKEQFQCIWYDQICRSTIEKLLKTFLPRHQMTEYLKSPQKSKRYRTKGNNYFRISNFQEALHEYSKAVILAPYPTSEAQNDAQMDTMDCLALALNNRSATLFSMNRYTHCLGDIELSIKYGYPKSNLYKLLIRKVKCLHLLSLWTNDFEDIKKSLATTMRNSKVGSVARSEIEKMFKFLEEPIVDTNNDADHDTIDGKSYKIAHHSKLLPKASDFLEMAYTPESGRHLIASKQTQFGQPLIVEEPFATYLAPCYILNYCYNCFKKLYGLGIGCRKCNQVIYCSEECRDTNWDLVHYLECIELLPLQAQIGIAYIALHIISVPRLETIIRDNEKAETTPESTHKNLSFKLEDLCLWPDERFPGDYRSLSSLLDHHSDHEANDVFVYALTAALLVEALAQSSVCKPLLIEEKKQLILGEILMTHLMQLSTNAIAVLDQQFNELSTEASNIKENPIGIAIYVTTSLLNHSCKPNVLTMFQNNKMIVRAGGSIQPGDEVYYCYGPSVRTMSKKDRQLRLKSQYYFDCSCHACINDEEDETRALHCCSCEGPVIYNRDYTSTCMKCKSTSLDVQLRLKQIEDLRHWFFVETSSQHISKDIQKSKQLMEGKQKISDLVYWKNPIMIEVRKGLYEYFKLTKEFQLALDCLNEHIDYLIRIYGPISFEVVKESMDLITFKHFLLNNNFKSREEASKLLAFIDETRSRLKEFISCTNIKEAEQLYNIELQFLRDKHYQVKNILEQL